MKELKEILLEHASKYLSLQPQDAVKLIYQNEFGGGHIISDAATSLNYLVEEMASVASGQSEPLCEDIGNGICRLNLGSVKSNGYSQYLINKLFVASANRIHSNISSFEEKLDVLQALADGGSLPFSAQSLYDYLTAYQKDGYPMVRHSNQFREAYHPAYRVVEKRYVDYLPLFIAIDQLLSEKDTVTIAIDGRCGSGKTTLANITAEIFDCSIIRMDDFFLPLSLRTDTRLGEAGGNIHYERFLDEVILGLRSGKPFQYRIFDCSEMDYADQLATAESKPLTIIEGSYSLHPLFASTYDLKVFTTCPPQEQQRRILERSGPDLLERFLHEWIPMEERYFEEHHIPDGCDLVLSGQQTI